jgi:hypothetical protein
MFRTLLKAALVISVLWGMANLWLERPIRRAPGILAPGEPVQIAMVPEALPGIGDYKLQAVASYELTARVLSTERYWLADASDLVPVDVAVGWGPMSDEGVLSGLNISQNNRFFFYRWENRPPIPSKDIAAHAANIHVISANDEVARTVKRLRRGEIVTMRGFLVNAARDDGWHWRSSLSRTDTGRGACELFYVQECRPGVGARVAAR